MPPRSFRGRPAKALSAHGADLVAGELAELPAAA
jgi:hypothetical protein